MLSGVSNEMPILSNLHQIIMPILSQKLKFYFWGIKNFLKYLN